MSKNTLQIRDARNEDPEAARKINLSAFQQDAVHIQCRDTEIFDQVDL